VSESRPWRDEQYLHEQYVENKKSTLKLADECGCTHRTIRIWLDKYGIETRPSTREKPPHFRTRKDGYEEVKCKVNGETKSILTHRLLAVAEYGVDSVEDVHVHHINKIPWDNRYENIQLISNSEHGKLHEPQRKRDENGNFA